MAVDVNALIAKEPSAWSSYPGAVQELVRWLLTGKDSTGATAFPSVTVVSEAAASGTFGYAAGVSGTLAVGTNIRVVSITAVASSSTNGSLTINGGTSIVIPQSGSFSFSPATGLIAPTLVFANTVSYFVETSA